MSISDSLREKHGEDGWEEQNVLDMLVERASIYQNVYDTAVEMGESETATEVEYQIEEIWRIIRTIDEDTAQEEFLND